MSEHMEQAPQSPGRGIFWMIVTGLCFVMVTALVKLSGDRIPASESAFLRYVMGFVFLVPMLKTLLSVRLTRRPAFSAAISWLMQKIRMSLSWIVARPLTEGVTVSRTPLWV